MFEWVFEPIINRWLFSTNHKDIGTLYLLFSKVQALWNNVISINSINLSTPGDTLFNGNINYTMS